MHEELMPIIDELVVMDHEDNENCDEHLLEYQGIFVLLMGKVSVNGVETGEAPCLCNCRYVLRDEENNVRYFDPDNAESVIALEPSKIAWLPAESCQEISQFHTYCDYFTHSFCLHTLRSCSIFRHLSHSQLSDIVFKAVRMKRKRGEKIVRQGDKANLFFFIMSGECNVITEGTQESDETNILAVRGPGDYFGERVLLTNTAAT